MTITKLFRKEKYLFSDSELHQTGYREYTDPRLQPEPGSRDPKVRTLWISVISRGSTFLNENYENIGLSDLVLEEALK